MFFRKKTLERENAELRKRIDDLLAVIDGLKKQFETLAELEKARKRVHEAQIMNLKEELACIDSHFNMAIAKNLRGLFESLTIEEDGGEGR